MQRVLFLTLLIGGLLFLGFLADGLYRMFASPPPTPRVTVTIPEGATVRDINRLLAGAGVLEGEELSQELEGYLFPDTYEFFIPSGASVVEAKFRENFEAMVYPLFPDGMDDEELRKILVMASLIEREVPDSNERKIVSGVLWKRLENGAPLQVDASICYIKEAPCLPITEEDKAIDSEYNTYKYRGLPPGPIGNPGLDTIDAALRPTPSPYWYYLSNPRNRETIFSRTLDEHNQNIIKYLSD